MQHEMTQINQVTETLPRRKHHVVRLIRHRRHRNIADITVTVSCCATAAFKNLQRQTFPTEHASLRHLCVHEAANFPSVLAYGLCGSSCLSRPSGSHTIRTGMIAVHTVNVSSMFCMCVTHTHTHAHIQNMLSLLQIKS